MTFELHILLEVVHKWRHRIRGRGFLQIMTADDGEEGFAEDDVFITTRPYLG